MAKQVAASLTSSVPFEYFRNGHGLGEQEAHQVRSGSGAGPICLPFGVVVSIDFPEMEGGNVPFRALLFLGLFLGAWLGTDGTCGCMWRRRGGAGAFSMCLRPADCDGDWAWLLVILAYLEALHCLGVCAVLALARALVGFSSAR